MKHTAQITAATRAASQRPAARGSIEWMQPNEASASLVMRAAPLCLGTLAAAHRAAAAGGRAWAWRAAAAARASVWASAWVLNMGLAAGLSPNKLFSYPRPACGGRGEASHLGHCLGAEECSMITWAAFEDASGQHRRPGRQAGASEGLSEVRVCESSEAKVEHRLRAWHLAAGGLGRGHLGPGTGARLAGRRAGTCGLCVGMVEGPAEGLSWGQFERLAGLFGLRLGPCSPLPPPMAGPGAAARASGLRIGAGRGTPKIAQSDSNHIAYATRAATRFLKTALNCGGHPHTRNRQHREDDSGNLI